MATRVSAFEVLQKALEEGVLGKSRADAEKDLEGIVAPEYLHESNRRRQRQEAAALKEAQTKTPLTHVYGAKKTALPNVPNKSDEPTEPKVDPSKTGPGHP